MKQVSEAKMQIRHSYPALGLLIVSTFLLSGLCSEAYAQSATESDIYSFTGTSGTPLGGANPEAGFVPGFLQGIDGNLYGTSFVGGTSNFGTVFQVTTGGTQKLIYSFTGGGDGAFPVALVQGADGTFYGTTTQTGTTTVGTVFKLTSSGTLTTLQNFAATDFGIPEGLVIGKDGNLYGTTAGASGVNDGTIFKISLPAGTYSILYTFRTTDGATPTATADPDGLTPNVLIQGADGNLYGTTTGSTSLNSGEVFELTLPSEGSPTFSVLYNFGASTTVTDGTTPTGLIQGKDGNLYGTTVFGGANGLGTVYSLSLTDSTLTYLHQFPDPTATSWDGTQPGLLVQGADGNFYVATQPLSIADGGAAGVTYGTILQVTTSASAIKADTNFTTIATFVPAVSTQGFESPQGLIQASDGNFYGTTFNGGTSSLGSVYKVAVSESSSSVGGSGDVGGSGGGAFAPLVSLPLLLAGILRRRLRKGGTRVV